jgi:outer membrane lipoprotein-sorting protein
MRLRLVLLAGLAGLSLSAVAAEPMTADALVAKLLAASGGAGKLRAIKSMHTVGRLRLGGGVEAKTESFVVGPDKIRFEFSLQGLTAINAWDGKEAWAIQPFQGRREPQKVSDDDAKGLILAADITGPLLDWKAKGNKIEYLGTEDIDGTDAHKLRVTFKNGDSRVSFIDPDHFLEIRIEDHQFIRGQEQVSTTDLGEYALVDGVYLPMEQGQNQIESIQLNTPIDASIFAFPTPKP